MGTWHPVPTILPGLAVFTLALSHNSAAQTLWTSPHGPGLRGLSPASVAAQPALKWKLLLPQGIGHGGVTFGDGGKYLYFKTYGLGLGRVYKVAAATGKFVWISPIDFGRLNMSGVTVDGPAGRLYTAGTRNSVPDKEAFAACLDMATGRVVWQMPVSHPPVTVGAGDGNVLLSPDRGTLYLHDVDGLVWALDAENGALRWVHPVPRSPYTVNETLGPAWRDPSSGRSRLVVCSNTVQDSI